MVNMSKYVQLASVVRDIYIHYTCIYIYTIDKLINTDITDIWANPQLGHHVHMIGHIQLQPWDSSNNTEMSKRTIDY